MYLRIMNQMDVTAMTPIIKDYIAEDGIVDILTGRVTEIIQTLDDYYGCSRCANSMGGFVFLFLNADELDKEYEEILKCYNLNEAFKEYSDDLYLTDMVTWKEELYLRSSDDSILILYPKRKENREHE